MTAKESGIRLLDSSEKYALFPVWYLNTFWKGEKYTFAMNGQNGKLAFERTYTVELDGVVEEEIFTESPRQWKKPAAETKSDVFYETFYASTEFKSNCGIVDGGIAVRNRNSNKP